MIFGWKYVSDAYFRLVQVKWSKEGIVVSSVKKNIGEFSYSAQGAQMTLILFYAYFRLGKVKLGLGLPRRARIGKKN